MIWTLVGVEPKFPGPIKLHYDWRYAGDYASKELCESAAQQLNKNINQYRCIRVE
jgi:phosphoribosyl-dephospho-CoA transferase